MKHEKEFDKWHEDNKVEIVHYMINIDCALQYGFSGGWDAATKQNETEVQLLIEDSNWQRQEKINFYCQVESLQAEAEQLNTDNKKLNEFALSIGRALSIPTNDDGEIVDTIAIFLEQLNRIGKAND